MYQTRIQISKPFRNEQLSFLLHPKEGIAFRSPEAISIKTSGVVFSLVSIIDISRK